jgi:DNA-binding winged helix-turn-helix (wHTH) protein
MSLENPRPLASLTIDLAHSPDFRLGGLLVSPSTRQVICGADRLSIEPRVMQVLVALHLAAGKVLSRDDLMTQCWEGRVVGEDSLNRAIWRLRKLAESQERAHFVIETIPRIGYRLKTDPPGPAHGNAGLPDIARLWIWGLLAALAVSLGLLVWTLWLADRGDAVPAQMLGTLSGQVSGWLAIAKAYRC